MFEFFLLLVAALIVGRLYFVWKGSGAKTPVNLTVVKSDAKLVEDYVAADIKALSKTLSSVSVKTLEADAAIIIADVKAKVAEIEKALPFVVAPKPVVATVVPVDVLKYSNSVIELVSSNTK